MLTLKDVIAASYAAVESPPPMTKANTALLLIDIQELATPEHLASKAVAAGLEAGAVNQALANYAKRFYAAVDNCALLLNAARAAEIPCVHIRIESLSGNARDTGPAHKRMGWCYPPGSEETRFLNKTAPVTGEIVIHKSVSGAFTATNLDSVLRHMGIQRLIIAGFETDECVEATGRTALDLGYITYFAADACTAYEASAHEHFMGKYAEWGLTRTTDDLAEKLGKLH